MARKTKKRIGRPPLPKGVEQRDEQVSVMFTARERQAVEKAAHAEGLYLSQFVRKSALRGANTEPCRP